MKEEKWKPIKGYEGLYEVSSFGNVKALAKEWIAGWNNVKRNHPDIILKPGKNRDGYLSVSLSKNKIIKHYSVHRLVLQSFLGESNLDCNHKDGIKTNNNLSNLEYCSESENILHSFKIGLNNNKGENHRSSKLNSNIIKNIRKNKFKFTTKEFVKRYGVTRQSINDIINHKTWKHVL